MKELEELLAKEKVDLFDELSNADREENRLNVEISNMISERRKKMHLTQKQFADMLHVSQPMVSQWESGDYNFTISMIAQIMDVLQMKISLSFSEKDIVADEQKDNISSLKVSNNATINAVKIQKINIQQRNA